MPGPADDFDSGCCQCCGRRVGLLGRLIDAFSGCRWRGCNPSYQAAEKIRRAAPPPVSAPEPRPRIRFEGHPF